MFWVLFLVSLVTSHETAEQVGGCLVNGNGEGCSTQVHEHEVESRTGIDHDHYHESHQHSQEHVREHHAHDHEHSHNHHHTGCTRDHHEHGHEYHHERHEHKHGGCPHKHEHAHDHTGGGSCPFANKGAHGHSHSHGHGQKAEAKGKLPVGYELCRELIDKFAEKLEVSPTVFGALASTIFVGVVPVFLLFFIPLVSVAADGKKTVNHCLLKVLLAFAVGGLLGDVFLHLYPHAVNPHSHGETGHGHDEHNHDAAIFIGLYLLAGIFIFFLIEKLVILCGGSGHGHSHSNKKEKQPSQKEIEADRLRVSGILNIIADFVHNFTDGMAISSSFLVGIGTGLTTAVAVCIHEFPHEIGDLAILVKSGATPKKVILIQFGTALGCVAGAAFGLFVGSLEGVASEAILPVTAGGFIYVATVGVIPQLFESTSFKQTLMEALAMVLGVAIMAYIAFELE